MYQLQPTDFLLIALGIWLTLLSFFLIKTIGHYRRLTKGAANVDLGSLLERIIKGSETQEENLSSLSKELEKFQSKAQGFLQKFALIRFNPFEDEGGDQSFVVALLDGKNDGVVISSLHSRVGVRVYAKSVQGSKAAKHQFSKEEKEAVEKAARQA